MRVGLFTDTYAQLNGVAVHVHNLAYYLSNEGVDVTVFTGSGRAKKFSSDKPANFKVYHYPRIPFPPAPKYEILFPTSFGKDLDIFHSHTVYPAGWAGLIGGKVKNKPTVITSHTAPSHFFSMYHLNFLEPLGWSYLISFMNKFDHVVCQTHATEERFRKHGLDRPVTIASAGIDAEFWLGDSDPNLFRSKYGVKEDFALSVIRASPEKRPEFFLKACKELGIKAVLCSTGPMLDELKEKYPEATFVGRLSREELRSAYHAAKVFVLPSTDETEGLVALEAMITENAVIATDLPCIKEFIKDGKTGYTFHSYDELKAKLKHLWEDDSFRKKVVKNGEKEAMKRDIRNTAKKLIKLYEELLRNKS
ncbi:hypothetical protein DRN74_03020 [Candidatus Micrarchaeota archaeon]|nr:MAG: hypothetical protein DRN74_03020 [Candidatus Micrarchaeota archaeon]